MADQVKYELEKIWDGQDFVLFRGLRPSDGARFIVSAPGLQSTAGQSLTQLENAFSLRKELDPAWSAKPVCLDQQNGQTLLISNDPGGELLARAIGKPWELTPFLRVSIGLVNALASLHRR